MESLQPAFTEPVRERNAEEEEETYTREPLNQHRAELEKVNVKKHMERSGTTRPHTVLHWFVYLSTDTSCSLFVLVLKAILVRLRRTINQHHSALYME